MPEKRHPAPEWDLASIRLIYLVSIRYTPPPVEVLLGCVADRIEDIFQCSRE